MPHPDGDRADVFGPRDRASFLARLTQHHQCVVPVQIGGVMRFVTGDPAVAIAILRDEQRYTQPSHPYRQLTDLYTPVGRYLLKLPAAAEPAKARRVIHAVLSVATTTAAQAASPEGIAGVRLLAWARELMFRAIGKLLFGIELSAWSRDFVEAAAFIEGYQVMSREQMPDPALLPRLLEACEVRHRAAAAILRTGSSTDYRQTPGACQPRVAIIETLMNGYNGLAVALAWVLYELCRHPAIYRDVCAEVDAVAAQVQDDRVAIARLSLLRNVILETLRLHPVAWTLGRVSTRAHYVGAQHIPSGTGINACIYAVHRHRAFWSHPDVFDPTRFNGGAPKNAFMPFGHGGHACPSGHLVPTLLQTVVAVLLGRYHLRVKADATTNRTFVSLMPDPEPRLFVVPRVAGLPGAAP